VEAAARGRDGRLPFPATVRVRLARLLDVLAFSIHIDPSEIDRDGPR
jgi:hypothetical protein